MNFGASAGNTTSRDAWIDSHEAEVALHRYATCTEDGFLVLLKRRKDVTS
jgi:hypothetical protein